MTTKQKWAQAFRNILTQGTPDLKLPEYTDEEVLECAKGIMAGIIHQQLNIHYDWQYELYWQSMLMFEPPEGLGEEIDLQMFKTRIDNQRN